MTQTATAEQVSRAFGRFGRQALQAPLTITHHGQDSLVLLSHEEYQRLKRRDRVVMTLADFTDEDRAAVAASQPHPDAEAFNHEVTGDV